MSEKTPLALPTRPHINWLKNRAREKLELLRAAVPTTKLAEAQVAIAREYGFASWQKLKAQVAMLAFQAALDEGDAAAMAHLLLDHPSLALTHEATWTHNSGKRMVMPVLFTAACQRKNLEMVRSLVNAGADVNNPAVYVDGRPDIMEFLLDSGMNPNAITFPENCTGLMYAAYIADVENARLLIHRGADPNIALENSGTRALHWLPWRGDKKDPAKTVAIARLLIDAGADVNARIFNGLDDQPIIDHGNLYLVEHGGSTVLHTAAANGMTELVRCLLDAGADPNIQSASFLMEKVADGDKRWRYQSRNLGFSPRDLAKDSGHMEVAGLLQNRGVAPRQSGPSSVPINKEVLESFADAIMGEIDIVRRMLDANPPLARAAMDGQSMLHYAAGNNRVAAIRLLIERGADPNAYWVGVLHTPLSWAITNDWPEASRVLVECGARVDLFCAAGMGRLNDLRSFFDATGQLRPGSALTGSSRRRDDGTRITELSTDPVELISDALYIACRNGRVETALHLLDRGANPNFRGYMSATCFHWSYFGGGDPTLIQAMLSHGADPNATTGEKQYKPLAFGILVAARWGWPYYLDRILDNNPALVNLAESGTTPLHESVYSGKPEMVKLLQLRGADLARMDSGGKTALDLATALNQNALVPLLQR